jgi:hypothetical protein
MNLQVSNRKLAVARKTQILALAKAGKSRPNSKDSALGKALLKYITNGSTSYDGDFKKELLRVAPAGWFRNEAEKKKSKLVKMAMAGKPRPSFSTPLGKALKFYTSPSHTAYCKETTLELFAAAPEWFRRAVIS